MSELTTGKRIYRNPIADNWDQLLFFGLFLAGSGLIWSLKVTGFSQVIVTIFPLALMIVYVAIALVTKRFRIREDRVGDNIYYLGFLYTLVSLSYALYVYSPDGSGATEIITNFGIAISTTILGLAGRVFFNQMREDPVEYEREARYSLAESSMALRSELADISTELSSFKRRITQIMEEGVVDVSNVAKQSMAQSAEQFSKSASEVIIKIKDAFSAFADHSSQLNKIASKNVKALEALFLRIEKIEASPELLANKFDPVVNKFSQLADEATRRYLDQAQDIDRMRAAIEAAINAATNLSRSMGDSYKVTFDKVDALTKSLERATTVTDQFVKVLGGASGELRLDIATIRDTFSEASNGIAAQMASIASLRSTIETDLTTISSHRDYLRKMLSESTEAVGLLQSSLISLTETMVGELRGN